MLSTPHLLVGATVGSFTGNPILAFIAGFVSHFLMDMIPHWDWKPNSFWKKLFAFFDFFFGAALLFVLTKNAPGPLSIWAGAMGGVFPDVLSAPYYLLNQNVKWLEPFRDIHGSIQKSSKKFPIYAGVLTQVVALAITTWLLTR